MEFTETEKRVLRVALQSLTREIEAEMQSPEYSTSGWQITYSELLAQAKALIEKVKGN